MTVLGRVLASSLRSTAATIVAASLLLVYPDGLRRTLLPGLLSNAVGTLLATAFLGLAPHAREAAPALPVLGSGLAGV